MHGLGNDFVVIDAIQQQLAMTPDLVRFLADRRRGVGCDQVLLVERPRRPEADFYYRIYNADGNEVEQCGNGARCFARFVQDHGLTDKTLMTVETRGGTLELRLEPDGEVTVDMGRPLFAPRAIPFDAESEATTYELKIEDRTLTVGVVSMGNPHAVLRVDDIGSAPVAILGPAIEHHARFPQRVNAGFMQVLAPDHIRLRVFERGVGETQACGTGACAAVVVGRQQGLLDAKVTAELPGGSLSILWEGGESNVKMTGPATHVFEGQIEL